LQTIRSALQGTEQDFTQGSVGRAVVLLAIPLVLEMAMESLFAIVNILWVSRLGASAIAAVGLTESLLAITYTVAMGLAMSAAAMVARRTGEKDHKGASVAAAQALWMAAGASVLLGVPGGLLAPKLLELMGASPEVVSAGTGFARIMLGGQAVIVLLFICNGVFRGTGDAAIAMRTLWIANAINLVLDPCLIFGLGPFPELGVTGTAVATTLGRGAGVAYQFSVLLRRSGRLSLTRDTFAPVVSIIGRLFRMSLGGMGQYLIATFSWVLLVRIISRFGDAALAGYTVAIRVIMVVLLPAWGLSNAAATLVGQNLGARQPERAESSVWRAAFYNMGFMAAVSLGLVLFTEEVVAPFSSDPSVVPIAVGGLRTLAYGLVFYGMGMVMMQAFNGAGDTGTPTLLNVLCFWMAEIPAAWGLAVVLGLGPPGVFWALALAYSLSAVLGVLIFRRGRWKTRAV
jgi:putative MATE family efflux protein